MQPTADGSSSSSNISSIFRNVPNGWTGLSVDTYLLCAGAGNDTQTDALDSLSRQKQNAVKT